jgi:hypothetical protein
MWIFKPWKKEVINYFVKSVSGQQITLPPLPPNKNILKSHQQMVSYLWLPIERYDR